MEKITLSTNNSYLETGYMALFPTLIICLILLVLALGFAVHLATSRASQLDEEFKAQSKQLAQSCAGQALLKYAMDPQYAGNEAVLIDNQSCDIHGITIGPAILTVTTAAKVDDLITVMQTTAQLPDLKIVSQSEIN